MGEAKRRAKVLERRGNVFVMDRRDPNELDGKCEFCGRVEELRPYGPNNESICFDCAMKDKETTNRKFAEFFEQH